VTKPETSIDQQPLKNTKSLLRLKSSMSKFPYVLVCSLAIGGCTSTPEVAVPLAKATDPLYNYMTESDIDLANKAMQKSLETSVSGKPVQWRNPQSGNSGFVVPVQTYYLEVIKTYCREYRKSVTIGRETESYQDASCRDKNGFWEPIDT
jgi:surface antigen